MHAFALIGSQNLTVMIPSGPCYRSRRTDEIVSGQSGYTTQKKGTPRSYTTTFVASPRVIHSSFTSSLRSKGNLGSSSNSSRVNMCFRTTRPSLFVWLLNLSVTAGVEPNPSSESQSSNFLSLLIRSVQQEVIRETHLYILPILFVALSSFTIFLSRPYPPGPCCLCPNPAC